MKLRLLLILAFFTFNVLAQIETLSNQDIIDMVEAGFSKALIIDKIKTSQGNYDTSTKALIELKKAQVDEEIIKFLMLKTPKKETVNSPLVSPLNSEKVTSFEEDARNPTIILKNARTLSIKKTTLHPSIKALEKELLKRSEWKNLKMVIVQASSVSDLTIEISRVKFSLVTHRYTFRIVENKSGIVIAAGETTSWGSLAENLARNIAVNLAKLQK
jgi:hypothetical protein